MPPEDWVKEAEESVKRGYTSIKLKARPWRDIFEQVEAVGKVVPEGYKLDIDFNGFSEQRKARSPFCKSWIGIPTSHTTKAHTISAQISKVPDVYRKW